MKFLRLLFIFFIISNLNSQNSAIPKQLSLNQCYEIALSYNPDIMLANAQLASNGAAITAAFGSFLPSVNFNMGYNRQLNSEGSKSFNLGGQTIFLPADNPNSYNMGVSASYMIFNGFDREANYNKAQRSLEAFERNNNYTNQRVLNDVYTQFIDIVRNFQIINLRREAIELAKKDLEKTKAQFEAGVIPSTMIYTQEAEIGNKELDYIKAENDLRRAKANLLTTMGLSPDLNVEFLDNSIPSTIEDKEIKKFRDELGNFDNLLKIALSNRQDYTALKLNIIAKEYDITSATSAYYPKVSANGGWSWSNNEFNKFSDLGRYYFGLNLSMPIFDNFNTNYQIENSKFQLNQIKIQLYQLEQMIRGALQNSLLNLEAAEKQIEISKMTIIASEKSFESTRERFNGGIGTISDYFLATNQKINSQINLLTSVYNYQSVKKQLNFIIGVNK